MVGIDDDDVFGDEDYSMNMPDDEHFENMCARRAFQDAMEDEERIDFFLDNNKQVVICEYFLRGHCHFGDNCKYLHPKS